MDLTLAQGDSTVRLRGWQSSQGPLVAAARLYEGGRLYEDILHGALQPGDPLAGGPACREPDGSEGTFRLRRFAVASARFTAEVCVYPSGGRSSRYVYLAIDVRDASEVLPPELRDTAVHLEAPALEAPALEALLTHFESHHNWCDNFYLRVPALAAGYVDMRWPEPTTWRPAPTMLRSPFGPAEPAVWRRRDRRARCSRCGALSARGWTLGASAPLRGASPAPGRHCARLRGTRCGGPERGA